MFTFSLSRVTKTEFLLTISTQYQADKWWESRKISVRGLLVDPIPTLQTNMVIRIVWQKVRRITNKILGVGLFKVNECDLILFKINRKCLHEFLTQKHSTKGGYGWLIHSYLSILIAKLEFHQKVESYINFNFKYCISVTWS